MGRMSVRARRAGRLRGDHGMHQLLRPLPCLFVLAALAGTSHDAFAARPKQIQQEKKPAAATARPGTAVKKEEKSARKDDKTAKKDDKTAKTEAKPKHVAKRHKKERDDDKAAENKP